MFDQWDCQIASGKRMLRKIVKQSKIWLFYATAEATLVLQSIDYYQEILSEPMTHFTINLGDFALSLLARQFLDSQYILGVGSFSGLLLVAEMDIKELEENDSVDIKSIDEIGKLKGVKLSVRANLDTMISSLCVSQRQASLSLTVGNANGFAIHYSNFLQEKLDEPVFLEIVKMDQSQVNCVYSFSLPSPKEKLKNYVIVGLYNSKILIYESEKGDKNYKLILVQNTEYSVMAIDGFFHIPSSLFKLIVVTAQTILTINFKSLVL